jgi:hypothetical protein
LISPILSATGERRPEWFPKRSKTPVASKRQGSGSGLDGPKPCDVADGSKEFCVVAPPPVLPIPGVRTRDCVPASLAGHVRGWHRTTIPSVSNRIRKNEVLQPLESCVHFVTIS